jgi:hypothetical protein
VRSASAAVPCGSGKKYKRCCGVTVTVVRPPADIPPPSPRRATPLSEPKPSPMFFIDDDDLDDVSNSVLDLI